MRLPLPNPEPGNRRHRVLGDPSRLDPAVRSRRASLATALVAMPFGSVRWPSIQIGTLAPIARSHGFPVETFHLNLHLASRVGIDRYEQLGDGRPAVGDWLFALEAFGDAAPADLPEPAFVERYATWPGVDSSAGPATAPRAEGPFRDAAELCSVRHDDVPAFLDEVVEEIDWGRFSAVGFSSTFQQNAASFALARRLRERFPHLVLLFGGSNFEGVMGREWVRSIPVIDYAVSGEGDRSFPQLLAALADGADPVADRAVPGVLARRDGQVVGHDPAPPFEEMDELPVPDYHDYFERSERLGALEPGARRLVRVPFETARGCWWGAKRHCTFCGLNGGTMQFRAKSPGRVVAELAELARRHHSFDLNAVDNIMELDYIDEVFARLAASETTYRLFYEVKADLSREQLRRLRAGGVRQIQPGIESLSSRVLGLMRKGTRASTNVNLLRWAGYYGIDVSWNILWGFPGETPADYTGQNELIRQCLHLQPPSSADRIWLERFSPLFTDAERFPARFRTPISSMAHVYPATVDLEQAAYFFDYELEDALPDSAYLETAKLVDAWRDAWGAKPAPGEPVPALQWWAAPGLLQIEDGREAGNPGTHTFDDPLASIYLACSDAPTKAEWVRERLGLPYPIKEVAAALDEFCARGLMMRDGNLFLALALPATGGHHGDPRHTLRADGVGS